MAFGDPFQQQHMIAGVQRAISSPNTPSHLRPHLAARLRGGNMQPMAPRKTIVGPTGRTPIKAVTARTNTTPIKTLVGSTAQPPRKTLVGSTAAPPRKTLVGSTAAPPLKTTPGNLGVGFNGPRPRNELAAPNSTADVSLGMQPLGNRDGNPQRSVAPMPPPAQGPPNPVLDSDGFPGKSSIRAGGMGQTRADMRPPRPRRQGNWPKMPRNQFFGE